MKGHALFQGKIIMKQGKYIDIFLKKIFLSRTTWPISIKLSKNYAWVKGIYVGSIKGHTFFPRGDNNEIVNNTLMKFTNFNQTWRKSSVGKLIQMNGDVIFKGEIITE